MAENVEDFYQTAGQYACLKQVATQRIGYIYF